MQQAEKTQRPFERQREINQRRRIERHRVPLGEERHAAVIVGIPKWNFAAPETFALEVGEWIDEKSKVADNERLQAEDNLRKRRENQQREENSEWQRFEPFVEWIFYFALHAQIKTGGVAKCNCAQLTPWPRGLTLSKIYEPIARFFA